MYLEKTNCYLSTSLIGEFINLFDQDPIIQNYM